MLHVKCKNRVVFDKRRVLLIDCSEVGKMFVAWCDEGRLLDR